MTDEGVTFEATKYRALPMTDAPTTSNSFYVGALPLDENPPSNEFQSASPGDVTALVTGGSRGLDFVSGIFNLPSGITSTFSFGGSIDASAFNDGTPDLVFAKLGWDAAATPDDADR